MKKLLRESSEQDLDMTWIHYDDKEWELIDEESHI